MSSHEEFKAWFAKHFPKAQQSAEQGAVSALEMRSVASISWKASREALVIELPNRFAEKYQDYYDDVEGGCFNEARYINDLTAAIEAAGVKVKP